MKTSSLRYGVVIGFFLLCLLVVGIQLSTQVEESPEVRQAQDIQHIQDIYFWGWFWQIAALIGGIIVASLVVIISLVWCFGYLVEKLTHHAIIGDSDIPISQWQLQHMSPMVGGIVCARNIEAHSKSEAFQIYRQAAKDFLGLAKKNISGHADSVQAMLPAVSPVEIPSLSDLIATGDLAPGKPLIFGYAADGQPYSGHWSDAYSMGVIGESGSGKTSTAVLYLAESLLTGEIGSCLILDRQYPHPQSFLARLGALRELPQVQYFDFLAEFGSVKKKLQEFLQKYLLDELDRRLHYPNGQPPLVFITDETVELCRQFPFLAGVIFRIATAGRKAQVYEMCLSHSWKHDIIGGTEVRDNLVSKVAHKISKKSANLLLQNSEQSNIVPTLKTGQTLFVPTSGEAHILSIPKIASDDMEHIADFLKPVHPRVQGGTTGTPTQTLTPELCKQLREEQEISIRKLAELAELKSFVDVSKFERHERKFSDSEQFRVGCVLGLYQGHENPGTA